MVPQHRHSCFREEKVGARRPLEFSCKRLVETPRRVLTARNLAVAQHRPDVDGLGEQQRTLQGRSLLSVVLAELLYVTRHCSFHGRFSSYPALRGNRDVIWGSNQLRLRPTPQMRPSLPAPSPSRSRAARTPQLLRTQARTLLNINTPLGACLRPCTSRTSTGTCVRMRTCGNILPGTSPSAHARARARTRDARAPASTRTHAPA